MSKPGWIYISSKEDNIVYAVHCDGYSIKVKPYTRAADGRMLAIDKDGIPTKYAKQVADAIVKLVERDSD